MAGEQWRRRWKRCGASGAWERGRESGRQKSAWSGESGVVASTSEQSAYARGEVSVSGGVCGHRGAEGRQKQEGEDAQGRSQEI